MSPTMRCGRLPSRSDVNMWILQTVSNSWIIKHYKIMNTYKPHGRNINIASVCIYIYIYICILYIYMVCIYIYMVCIYIYICIMCTSIYIYYVYVCVYIYISIHVSLSLSTKSWAWSVRLYHCWVYRGGEWAFDERYRQLDHKIW